MAYLTSNQIAEQFALRIADGSFQVRLTEKQTAWLLGQYRRENRNDRASEATGTLGSNVNKFWELHVYPNGAGFLNLRIVENGLVFDAQHPAGCVPGR